MSGRGTGFAATGCALALALALSTQAAAETAPLPEPRPGVGAPADAAPTRDTSPPPLPRPRPAVPQTQAGPAQESEPPPQSRAAVSSAEAREERACRRRLEALGVAFEGMEPIDDVGACGVAAPIEVTAVAGIRVSPPATLSCPMAEALARWAEEAVVPAAERHLDAEPAGLLNAASYVCRTRNNRPGAKLSEHATANALDIAGIVFEEGEAAPVVERSDEKARERRFQRAIRRAACEHFTTVIGPGTNEAHATHFHLDLAERRRGYRLC